MNNLIESVVDIFRTKRERAEQAIARANKDLERSEQAAQAHAALKRGVEAAHDNLLHARGLAEAMAGRLREDSDPDLMAGRFMNAASTGKDALQAAGDIAGSFSWLRDAVNAWPAAEKTLLARIALAEKELADFAKAESERAQNESV